MTNRCYTVNLPDGSERRIQAHGGNHAVTIFMREPEGKALPIGSVIKMQTPTGATRIFKRVDQSLSLRRIGEDACQED